MVNPGMILTPLTAKINADPAVAARRAQMTASRRLGRPEDIANVVAFLASERSAYVNGAELMATGGLHSMLMDLVPQPGLKSNQTQT
jgi:NAD(P)-dependent dehydrogenase (short-subunit alcohol dehydrogenase family)